MYLADFIDESAERQKKYFGFEHVHTFSELSAEQQTDLILKITSYIVEECVEVNRELHHYYKPFKAHEPINHKNLREEIADIYLYLAGLTAVAGISGREMEIEIEKKLNKNSVRRDHTTNENV